MIIAKEIGKKICVIIVVASILIKSTLHYFLIKYSGNIHSAKNTIEKKRAFDQSLSIKNSIITPINIEPETILTSFMSFSLFIELFTFLFIK